MTQVLSTARWLFDAAFDQTPRVLDPQPRARGDALILLTVAGALVVMLCAATVYFLGPRPPALGVLAVAVMAWMFAAWWTARSTSLTRPRDMSEAVAAWLEQMTRACEGDVSEALFAKLDELHTATQAAMDVQQGLYRCQAGYVDRAIKILVARSQDECADTAVIEFWRRRGLSPEQYKTQLDEEANRRESARKAAEAERDAFVKASAERAAATQRRQASAAASAAAQDTGVPKPPARGTTKSTAAQPVPAAENQVYVDPMDQELEN